jgi:heme exporter protein D
MALSQLKPAVPKHWLIAIAGLVWSAAGIMLCRMAWSWLQTMPLLKATGLTATGFLAALLFDRYLLLRLARRNIARIDSYAQKGCLFAFQAWRSYLIILVMILMGSLLRHTTLPREILSFFYTAMGGALLMASLVYYGRFWKILRGTA